MNEILFAKCLGMLSLCKYGQRFVWEGIQMVLETNLTEGCQLLVDNWLYLDQELDMESVNHVSVDHVRSRASQSLF